MNLRMLVLALFLVAGATVNAAVAWACVALVPTTTHQEIRLDQLAPWLGDAGLGTDFRPLKLTAWSGFGHDRLTPKQAYAPRRRGAGRERLANSRATAGLLC